MENLCLKSRFVCLPGAIFRDGCVSQDREFADGGVNGGVKSVQFAGVMRQNMHCPYRQRC